MNLRTAPCTNCKISVVYGQRQCLQCGQQFAYGPNPPPEPSAEIIQTAYAHALAAQQAPPRRDHPTAELDVEQQRLLAERLARREQQRLMAARPTPTPTLDVQAQINAQASIEAQMRAQHDVQAQLQAQADVQAQLRAQSEAQAAMQAQFNAQVAAQAEPSFVDRGRYEDTNAPVEIEDIPGFIDSTLFAAYTPKEDTSTPMLELEGTAYDGGDVDVPLQDPSIFGVELTSHAPTAGPVDVEDIPGFIDSTLFAAYTPDHVETEDVAGLEASPSRVRAFASTGTSDGDVSPCGSCGTGYAIDRSRCPACGAPRSTEL